MDNSILSNINDIHRGIFSPAVITNIPETCFYPIVVTNRHICNRQILRIFSDSLNHLEAARTSQEIQLKLARISIYSLGSYKSRHVSNATKQALENLKKAVECYRQSNTSDLNQVISELKELLSILNKEIEEENYKEKIDSIRNTFLQMAECPESFLELFSQMEQK